MYLVIYYEVQLFLLQETNFDAKQTSGWELEKLESLSLKKENTKDLINMQFTKYQQCR